VTSVTLEYTKKRSFVWNVEGCVAFEMHQKGIIGHILGKGSMNGAGQSMRSYEVGRDPRYIGDVFHVPTLESVFARHLLWNGTSSMYLAQDVIL
jgi:hypothetical protein